MDLTSAVLQDHFMDRNASIQRQIAHLIDDEHLGWDADAHAAIERSFPVSMTEVCNQRSAG
jgi:hypothetical protein